MDQDTTKTTSIRHMYAAGLLSGMQAYARGDMHLIEPSSVSVSPLVLAFDDGFGDADDDSDEPRPDDPEVLHALSISIFAEVDRVGADVSVWPDETDGTVHLADAVTEETHEPFALLAILRALPAGAGTDATWEALAVRL